MAYTAPNTFSDGTKIVAAAVEQNIDVLHSYVNGGVSSVDIDTSAQSNPFGLKHLMKGEYLSLINRYEFCTGPVQGTLGVNQDAGYAGNIIANTSGQSVSASGTGIDFYLEENADVFIHITAYPREYNSLDLAAVGLSGRTTTFSIKRTSAPNSFATTQGLSFTECEFGVNSTASNDGGIYGLERRRPYYGMYSEYLTAGNHSYSLRVGSNERTVPIFFFQINVYAYYRATS
jgi:hypothetical protein